MFKYIKVETSFSECSQALKNRISLSYSELISKNCLGSDWLGWLSKSTEIDSLEMIRKIKFEKEFDCVVVLGIGGSFLGTKAIYDFLSPYFSETSPYKSLYFAGHHADLSYHEELAKHLLGKNPLIVVASKSGKTRETIQSLRTIEQILPFSSGRFIAITEVAESSDIYSLARKYDWPVFEVPKDIGGRYSVFTPVGMVPLSLVGIDIESILRHLQSLQTTIRSSSAIPLTCAKYVESRLSFSFNTRQGTELLSYHQPKLASLIEWTRQLFAESEGKKGKGIFPVGMAYSTDLHSVGQMVQDGPRMFLECFIELGEPNEKDLSAKIFQASARAHERGGVPWSSIRVINGSREAMIAEYMFFCMISCAVACLSQEINPFDQPGVEEYKKEIRND